MVAKNILFILFLSLFGCTDVQERKEGNNIEFNLDVINDSLTFNRYDLSSIKVMLGSRYRLIITTQDSITELHAIDSSNNITPIEYLFLFDNRKDSLVEANQIVY